MNYHAIIVAGGNGKRMQTTVPKQFLLLNQEPVLMHTIRAFANSTFRPTIILVLAENDFDTWAGLCKTYQFGIEHQIVAGGSERFYSVLKGLAAVETESIVAIHDAVRPLVSQELIDKAYQIAQENGNAIPGVVPSDSLRLRNGNSSKIINRDEVRLIQTPQVFRSEQLKKAYQQAYSTRFTDDASVVEAAGFEINLIEGERSNIKITYPQDIILANQFLAKQDN
jgi:2-C-methyl-D-erythritol 4-phosphate cytidylyltransferase